MCAGAMTAVTTVASGIAFGAYDIAIAGRVEHMGRHPMGEGVDPNPRILSEKRVDRFGLASQEKTAQAYRDGKLQPDLITMATRDAEQGWGLATVDEAPR